MSAEWYPDESTESSAWFEARWARILALTVSLPSAVTAAIFSVAAVLSGSPGGAILGGLAGLTGFIVVSLSWRGFLRLEYPAFVHLFAVSVTIIVLSLPFVTLRAAVLNAIPAPETLVTITFWTPNEPFGEIATKAGIAGKEAYDTGVGIVSVPVGADVATLSAEGLASSELRCRVMVDGVIVQESSSPEGHVTCTFTK